MNKENSIGKINSLSELEKELNNLKDIIDSFDNKSIILNPDIIQSIQNLSEKKGSILGFQYSKDPTPKELLNVNRDICTTTVEAFKQVCNQIKTLHETDQKIFILFLVLNKLSNINYKHLAGSYSLISNAQKDIKENCKQTSIQGNQLKDLALMYLQHIKKERRFHFFNSITYKILVGITALSALICSLLL